MSKLLFTMTDAGRQELVNANKTGTNKVEIVSVGLGSRYYVTSTSQTNITNEIKRLTTIGGKVVSPDTIHVTAKDDSKDEYVVHTIGLYTNKGALFAVYSQEQAIINKASSTIALISSDIAIKTLDTKNITFGDIEFINPPATETVVGVARFANEQEIEAGTDDSLAVSAKRLKQAIVKHEQSRNHPDATLTSKGFVQLSSATNSASETLAATPKAVKAAYDLANAKYTAQDATTARKGIVQLSSATNSTSETLAATPKAVKAAYDLAAGKAPSNHTHSWEQITNVPVASLTVRGITQLSSATNSTSETLAATPKAVKAVMDETNKKAPLNSPALTGTPTTPTAPKGTNNTQIASTAYVMAAIAALVDSSPDALNTLNELAAALGNDPNFATTMTNALAGKQPKDATLTALAGLATAADRFPYFTGNDVASLATLTKVGRDILAKSTVAAVIEYLGLQETVKLASEALSTYGGVVNGDVIIKGILSLIGNELLIEKDNGFSGIHIRNKSTVAGSANGVDFSFGGAIMSSLICGIMENGANYIDVALSPAGNISDRRLLAFTLDGNIRQLIPRNGWSIQGYTKNSDFTQAMADAGWVRFPNGIIFQWCWGNTDASGWAPAPFPVGWPVRCFGLLACNVAGDSIASAIAGVKRLNDRDMQVTLMERSGGAVSKPFFCIGVGC